MHGAQLDTLETAEPELESQPSPSLGDAANEWLCAWCHNRVANDNDRLVYDGKSEFWFSNPEGIRFHILTFSQAPGCRDSGIPTLEHTWFADHAWSYSICDRCGTHLGWHYTGPGDFVGLIQDRIIRALLVRN